MKKVFLLALYAVIFCATAQSQNTYELNFRVGYSNHQGLLYLRADGSGVMRVRYYDYKCSCTVMVEEDLFPSRYNGSPILKAYSARYAGTNYLHPTYAPDLLYFSRDMYGRLNLWLTDAYGNRVPVAVNEVRGRRQLQQAYLNFGW